MIIKSEVVKEHLLGIIAQNKRSIERLESYLKKDITDSEAIQEVMTELNANNMIVNQKVICIVRHISAMKY